MEAAEEEILANKAVLADIKTDLQVALCAKIPTGSEWDIEITKVCGTVVSHSDPRGLKDTAASEQNFGSIFEECEYKMTVTTACACK